MTEFEPACRAAEGARNRSAETQRTNEKGGRRSTRLSRFQKPGEAYQASTVASTPVPEASAAAAWSSTSFQVLVLE